MTHSTLQRRRQRAVLALAVALAAALICAFVLLVSRAGSRPGAQRVAVPTLDTSTVATPALPPVQPTPAGGELAVPGPTLAAAPAPRPVDRAQLIDALNRLQAEAPITFQPEGTRLTAAGEQSVRRAVELLRGAPDVRVRVIGHSAVVPGSPSTAMRVSQARADVVAAALRAGGIAAERLEVSALGDTRPLATPAASRRVEIGVI